VRGRPRQDADVAARMSALAAALTSGGDQLDADAVDRARDILERTGQRLQLGAGHTVVALVGATGSGKSSLFNALAGMEIAEVGARRPMTRVPTACIWGEGNTDPLLDWLEVPEHRRVRRESVLDADRQAPLHGLVLLDLPDHDSTEVAHRLEVDRLVELVDLLIWVVDPQKYADDALHAGYLQRLVGHDGVMMVVLNQIDRLGPDEADTCRRDLRRLLDGDGLDSVRVLAVSAWRGDGVDELRSLLATSVQKRTAVMERAAADLQAAADDLAKGLASGEPGPGQVPGTEELVRELASAVGVPAVVEAVAAEYRRRGSARTEWPVLRWLRALNPDALGRLGITVAEDDLRMIATSLMPAAAPSQRPHVRLAVDMFLGRVVDPLPLPWATAVRTAVTAPGDDLVGAVDSAVSRVDLGLSAPGWWRGVGLMHIAFGLALLAGSGWLFLIGAVQLAGRLPPEVPDAMGVPLPVLLFLGGLGAGAVTAAISAWLVSVGARRRAAAAANRLYAAVHGIAEARIITRVQAVLDRHRVTREALAAVDLPPPTPALGGTSTQEFAIPGGQFGRDGAQDDGNGSGEPGEGVQDGASPAVRQDAARDEAPAIAPSS
jgi:GTP-binding protein EngB required for normal cell division